MPPDDQTFDDDHRRRSLSEHLRVLERELNRMRPRADTAAPPMRLPTCLGRPLGIKPVEFPSLASLAATAHARTLAPAMPYSRGPSFGRTAVVVFASILLLGTTAIVPPLIWHYTQPPAVVETQHAPEPALRTEQFAHSAREFGTVRLVRSPDAGPMPASMSLPESRFEPASGQGEAVLDTSALPRPPIRRPAVSGWAAEVGAQTPAWAPFGNGYSQ